MGHSTLRNARRIFTSPGGDTSLPARVLNLENNEYKVTYYEIISGASGSLTVPTGATINAGEFGLSGNAILSKIDGSNKPTFESPKTSGGTIVTASLNETTGAWVASGTYTDSNVALIYSIKIKAVNYNNLTYDNIIETVITNYVTLDTAQTLTNKRITNRVTTIVSSATPTINTDNCDAVDITVLATDITSMTTNLTGTPTNFQKLIIRIKDNGTARAITWGASFASIGATLPTTTVLGKLVTIGLIYNTTTSLWECVAVSQEI
jgi:hypothetical protein